MSFWKSGFAGVAAGALMLIGGCCTAWKAPLNGTVWTPVELADSDVKLAEPVPVWFTINPDGRVAGRGGVNNFFGQAQENEDGDLKFSLASTMMAGPNLPYEGQFMKVMNATRSYAIAGDKLTLFDDAGKVLATFKVGSAELKQKK